MAAVLTTLFVERAGKTQMEIFARGVPGAMCAGARAAVHPRAVALVAEQI